jgi:carotenoid cleavage dioxygenase
VSSVLTSSAAPGGLTAPNPYLAGNFAPVREELTATELRVTGTLPAELDGRYVRNGPNAIDPDPAAFHWFTGDGMVHGVRLRHGKADWFRSRYVRGARATAAFGGPETPGPRHGMGDVANTNVIQHAGATLAIVEAGSLPVALSDELETVTRTDFGGTLPGSFTAHPKRDPLTGELHAVAYYWEWPYVQYLVVGVDGRVRRCVDIDCPGGPMMHDFGLSERNVVLFDLPCTFSLDAVAEGASFPYRWNPDHAARVGVLPREGSATDVRWTEVSPCYVFHPLNAFDLPDGRVVIDVVRHERMFATDVRGPNEGPPTFERWTIDPVAGKVHEQRLDDRGQEFPRADERLLGRQHRWGYTVGFETSAGHGVDAGSVSRHDLVAGSVERRDDGERYGWGEVVFVPRSATSAEDDGWLMGFRYDRQADTSELVLLAAQDIAGDPVAVVHLPRRVPYGFHGNWLPAT